MDIVSDSNFQLGVELSFTVKLKCTQLQFWGICLNIFVYEAFA